MRSREHPEEAPVRVASSPPAATVTQESTEPPMEREQDGVVARSRENLRAKGEARNGART